jgi:hypothetical protein
MLAADPIPTPALPPDRVRGRPLTGRGHNLAQMPARGEGTPIHS